MAKLKAPLMSLGASGQLAKTLVFFPWKGINCVREYVIPSYSRTTIQGTQRDYVKDGVAMVHTALARADDPLDEEDQTAYAALASAKGRIITWFNQAIKLWVDVKVAGKTPVIYCNGNVSIKTVGAITMWIGLNEETGSDLTQGKFYFGTTRTNLIHSVDAGIGPGLSAYLNAEDLSAFLTAGTKYFWQFRPTADPLCVGADSGIYYFLAE